MNGRIEAELLGITTKSLIDAVTLTSKQRYDLMEKLVNTLVEFDVSIRDFDDVFGGVDNALHMIDMLNKKEFEQYLRDLGLI